MDLNYFEVNKSERETALIFNDLGKLETARGNLRLARPYLTASLEKSRKIINKFGQAETLYNLAKLDVLTADYENALKFAQESVEITDTFSSEVLRSKLRSAYFSSVYDRFELYISLLMKLHRQTPERDFARQSLQVSERARAREMLETLTMAEADFTKDASPENIQREKGIRALLNLKSDKLTDLLNNRGGRMEVDRLDNEIRLLNNELERIKADFRQNAPLYSSVKNPTPFDINEFQNRIWDENTVLLEFSFGREESYLWLIGKNEVNSYILPSCEEIENRLNELRKLIAAREVQTGETIESYEARVMDAEKSYWTQAHQLNRLLLGKTAEKIRGKRLIVVPDGKLHYFPLNALPFPDSEKDAPLLLFNESIYEPSAAILMQIAKIPSRPFSSDRRIAAVFSDPVFTNSDNRLLKPDGEVSETRPDIGIGDNLRFAESLSNLPRLTASRAEGEIIAETLGTSSADIFSGFAATRERILSPQTADYKIIHLATHGLVNEERPELSGLVMSGFDEKGQKLGQVVRLQDIYSLKLNADLVVLSACQTGIGKEVRGEGLQSLSNGFLNVGAKTVVSSLWKVEDTAAKELMTHFYKDLATGRQTTSESLRQAQIKMWQNPQFKAPFYWAAFILQGDHRIKTDIDNGFNWRIYLLFLLILIVAFGFYRRWSVGKHRQSGDGV